MRYLLLLYGDAQAEAGLPTAERRRIVDEHVRFGRMLRDRGALLMGEALDVPDRGRTLRFGARATGPTVTDGPFIESKEALGGFYVLECADADEAMELAMAAPRSPGLVAELRPIVPM